MEQILEEEELFSFFQNSERKLASELVLDSGATSRMIKGKSLFLDIDNEHYGTITNANSKKAHFVVEEHSIYEFWFQWFSKIRLSYALLVPNSTKKLV